MCIRSGTATMGAIGHLGLLAMDLAAMLAFHGLLSDLRFATGICDFAMLARRNTSTGLLVHLVTVRHTEAPFRPMNTERSRRVAAYWWCPRWQPRWQMELPP